jgi:hypothetical protein
MSEARAEQLRAAQAEYHRLLGRFVDRFARIEARLFELLAEYSGLSDKAAGAVFSGSRADNTMSLIKRLAVANSLPKKTRDDIDYVFTQVGIINKTRNDLLHYGITGTHFSVIRKDRISYTDFNTQNYRLESEHFDAMDHDLRKSNDHLLILIHGDQITQYAKEGDLDILSASWRYKPPPPTARPRMPRYRFSEPPLPPRS